MLASIAVISAITHRFNLPAIADAAKKLRCHEDELIRAMQPGQRDNERMLQPVPRRATAERRLACRAMGERIALLRKRLKLSQGDLAELLDVRQETISAWERGVNEVQVFDAVALADTLHVPLEVLTGRLPLPLPV